MGMTTHHPRWAIAFKFKARQATSILRKVEFQVGHARAASHAGSQDRPRSAKRCHRQLRVPVQRRGRPRKGPPDRRHGIGRTRRGRHPLHRQADENTELRTGKGGGGGNGDRIPVSWSAPVCGDKLEKPEGEAVWRCVNINCEAQVVERIIHFTSKDAMDIRSFGDANVRKFFELGYLKNIPGIYHLPFEKIRGLERGLAKRCVTNLHTVGH